MEENAYNQNDFFEGIIDNVILLNKEGRVEKVNQTCLDFLDYRSKEELFGMPMSKICKHFRLQELVDKSSLRDCEMLFLDRQGKGIPVSANITVRKDNQGGIKDIIFIFRDIGKIKDLISELTKSREGLKESYAELQKSNDELVLSEKLAFTGRIAAGIAHEIRNPLANVSMSIQQLKKSFKLDDPKSKHIEIVERNTERINFLITELLNCARPPKLNLRPYNIHKILRDVLGSTKAKIRMQKIKVTKKFTTKAFVIKIDREQMERALLNLVINAIEAMHEGGKLVLGTELDESFFIAKIQDTGRGIPEKDIIRIFDPFFSTKFDGVGLGLTLCYGVIVSHGGTIEVESKPKIGSTFTVSLPIEQRPTHTERERESKIRGGGGVKTKTRE